MVEMLLENLFWVVVVPLIAKDRFAGESRDDAISLSLSQCKLERTGGVMFPLWGNCVYKCISPWDA